MTEIKVSRMRVHRGDLMKDRAKNNIKVLKEGSKKLQIQVKNFVKEVAGVHILAGFLISFHDYFKIFLLPP